MPGPTAAATSWSAPSNTSPGCAGHSHQPTRQRERAMKRFKSIRHAQRFLSGVQRHLAALSAPPAPAVGGRLPTGDGRPLRGLERDHRGDDHGRRLNRRLGQDVSSKPRLITPNHHIGQLGWLKLTVPRREMARVASGWIATLELFYWVADRKQGRVARLARHELPGLPCRYPYHQLVAFHRGEG